MRRENSDNVRQMIEPGYFSHLFVQKTGKPEIDLAPIEAWGTHDRLWQQGVELLQEVSSFLLMCRNGTSLHVTVILLMSAMWPSPQLPAFLAFWWVEKAARPVFPVLLRLSFLSF